jgi:UDP-N-acetyl-D-mannosaminuronate dehydrogenase
MNANGMAIKGSRVLCIGLAHKPNADDMRETPTLVVMGMLRACGAMFSTTILTFRSYRRLERIRSRSDNEIS